MTVMLTVVLGLSTIISNKIKILGGIGNSVSSFYAAESGIEKTMYYDRKEIPKKGKNKGERGLCDICNTCADCDNCATTELSADGCDPITCTDCNISYNSTFGDRTYFVQAQLTPDLFLSCTSKGEYKNTTRTIKITTTLISDSPVQN